MSERRLADVDPQNPRNDHDAQGPHHPTQPPHLQQTNVAAGVQRVDDASGELAARHGLDDRAGTSPDGLSERYLYSPDYIYLCASGR